MKGEMKRQDKEEGEKYRWIDKMKGEKERKDGRRTRGKAGKTGKSMQEKV